MNYFSENLGENPESKKTRQTSPETKYEICLLCEEENIATYYCTTCQDELCQLCYKAHRIVKFTKNHELVPIKAKTSVSVDNCESAEPQLPLAEAEEPPLPLAEKNVPQGKW